MKKPYFCLNCWNWVDKLYRYIEIKNGEEILSLVCKKCLLDKSEEQIDSKLLYYSNSQDLIKNYIHKLKNYKKIQKSLHKSDIEDEVFYLEEIVMPEIEKKIRELKNNLI